MASLFKSMIVRILICLEISLFLTSTMAVSDFGDVGGFGRGSTKRFCGRMLTESLALICNNEYETVIHKRRRDETITADDYAYNDQPSPLIDDLPIQYQSYAYLSKLAPEAARSRVRRDWVARRGVYDECCRKPCSVLELKSYCKRKN